MKKIIAIILSTVVLSNLTAGVGFAYEPENATKISQSSNGTQDQELKKKSLELLASEIEKVNLSEKSAKEKRIEQLENEIQKVEKMSDKDYKHYKLKNILRDIFPWLGFSGLVVFFGVGGYKKGCSYWSYSDVSKDVDECKKRLESCEDDLKKEQKLEQKLEQELKEQELEKKKKKKLEINADIIKETIKKLIRKVQMVFHPDKFKGQVSEKDKKGLLNCAKDVLDIFEYKQNSDMDKYDVKKGNMMLFLS